MFLSQVNIQCHVILFLVSFPDSQCGAVIEKYKDRCLSYIDACAIVTRLEIEKVIPDTVSHKIQRSAPSEANEVLFLHLRSHSSLETLHKLCDVMISKSGYPKMNELGQFIKDNLPTVSCVAESSEHTFYVQCVFVQCVVYVFICVQSRPTRSLHTCQGAPSVYAQYTCGYQIPIRSLKNNPL